MWLERELGDDELVERVRPGPPHRMGVCVGCEGMGGRVAPTTGYRRSREWGRRSLGSNMCVCGALVRGLRIGVALVGLMGVVAKCCDTRESRVLSRVLG